MRTISSCQPYPSANITFIPVQLWVSISASHIAERQSSRINSLLPTKYSRIFFLRDFLMRSRIHRVKRSKRYDTSSVDLFLILSSESHQKLTYEISSAKHSSIIFSALLYPRLCHSSCGSHFPLAHVRFPSMINPMCSSFFVSDMNIVYNNIPVVYPSLSQNQERI